MKSSGACDLVSIFLHDGHSGAIHSRLAARFSPDVVFQQSCSRTHTHTHTHTAAPHNTLSNFPECRVLRHQDGIGDRALTCRSSGGNGKFGGTVVLGTDPTLEWDERTKRVEH